MLAVTCKRREVTTIEGFSVRGGLCPMQRAFITHDAFQGFSESITTISRIMGKPEVIETHPQFLVCRQRSVGRPVVGS